MLEKLQYNDSKVIYGKTVKLLQKHFELEQGMEFWLGKLLIKQTFDQGSDWLISQIWAGKAFVSMALGLAGIKTMMVVGWLFCGIWLNSTI